MLKRIRSFLGQTEKSELPAEPIATGYPVDFLAEHVEIANRASPYTMTSPERIFALIEATKYIVYNNIPGAFVECGVYKGGSMMAAALTLIRYGQATRKLYLYDTFQGMPKPDDRDVDAWGNSALQDFNSHKISDTSSNWAHASLHAVRSTMRASGYPENHVEYIVGMVEDTIPMTVPETIAFLRLDTDWYKSTMHEMTHLFPHVATGGIVLIDDYGHFQGARQAIDDYLRQNGIRPLLHRIDYTGRIFIKQ